MAIDSVDLLMPLAEEGRVEELLDAVRAVSDDSERITLCRTLIRKLRFEPGKDTSLEVMTALADYAIGEGQRLGGEFVQQANIICYNTSANLCDCWGDGLARERRHFEKGIEYALTALKLREQLGKGPGSMALATWALGKHQQSLGLTDEATSSFRRCVELETLAAAEAGKPAEISAEAPDLYLIAVAYLALMEQDHPSLDRLREVLAKMKEGSKEERRDAEIIESQLRETSRSIDAALWP